MRRVYLYPEVDPDISVRGTCFLFFKYRFQNYLF